MYIYIYIRACLACNNNHIQIIAPSLCILSVNYHRGFCIEFASTVTVVLATILDIPVSTTHCQVCIHPFDDKCCFFNHQTFYLWLTTPPIPIQVGAVVGVGVFAFGHKRVDFSLVGLICLSWLYIA